MTRKQEKRRAFLMSMMAMIVCVAMLVGSTFSWFTDTTSNTGNRIETGELKVELYKYNGAEYKNISDGKGDIFVTEAGKEDADDRLNGVLWEPGKTEVVLLQVENAGTLALNYNIVLDVKSDSTVNLADVLSYAIVPGMNAESYAEVKTEAAGGQFSWTSILAMDGVENGQVTAETITAAPNGALKAGDSDYFALVVHMDENAGNQYQEQAINIDVTIKGKQMASETDSFGDSYDESAEFAVAETETETEPETESEPDEEIEQAVYVNNDFEGADPTAGLTLIHKGNYSNVAVTGDENNHYLKMVRYTTDWACRFTLDLPEDISKNIVLEYELSAEKPGRANMYVKNSAGTVLEISTPDASGNIYSNTSNTTVLATFNGEDWIHFAYIFDFEAKTYSVYVDGELALENQSLNLSDFAQLYVQVNGAETNDLKLDNLKIYEGTEVRELP